LLDEIGDLPLSSQAVLLRVLQEGEVTPVGTATPIPVDVRIVAATHRKLDELAESGKFRPDLLARLGSFVVTLPPLQERREDLGILIAALLERHADTRAPVTFTLAAARAIFQHDWPLNVRELEKWIERALVLARGRPIDVSHFPTVEGKESPPASPEGIRGIAPSDVPMSDEDAGRRDEIVELLRVHNGNVTAVARAMGKARFQIQRWMLRYRISREP
jgi:DNA-binding NtrC family response regulator